MDQKVYEGQKEQLHEGAEPEQGDRISRAPSGLRHSLHERSLFRGIELRHQALDSLELGLCRSREREMADGLIAVFFTLSDGFRLCSQLLGDKPLERLHAGLLCSILARQASEIPEVFRHLFSQVPVWSEVRLIPSHQVASMTTFSGIEGLSH